MFAFVPNHNIIKFCSLKGPFHDPQLHSPIFTKKVEIFTSVEAYRYIKYVCKIFLANSFVWRNNRRIGYLLCRHEKYTSYWPMQQVNTVKRA